MHNGWIFGIAALVAVLVTGVLVAPSLIDWNEYKAFIAGQVKEATGRDLVINGDIQIALLPAPALVAEDIELSNLAGAASPEMALLKSVEVRIAFGPLLTGNIQIEEVLLVEPVVSLEVLADGSANWLFEPQAAPKGEVKAETGPASDRDASGRGLDVRLDNFVIQNGTLVYTDARSGTIEQIENIDARVAMASLHGPFESAGRFSVRGMPLGYELALGKIIHGRTMPVNLAIGAGAGNSSLKVSGTVVGLQEAPRFKGKMDLKGEDLAGLIRGVAGGMVLPELLSRAFTVRGVLAGSSSEVGLTEMSLNLGDALGSGTVAVELGEATSLQADVSVSRIDLDSWLTPAAPRARKAPGTRKAGNTDRVPPAPAPGKTAPSGPFSLPSGLSAGVRLAVDAVTYRGGLVRQVRASAELADGAVTLSQLSARMPGNTEVVVFGFLTPKDGKPLFEGGIEASASDFREVLAWLGGDIGGVPNDRLRKLKFKSDLTATPHQIQFVGLQTTVDSSHLTGGVTVVPGRRLEVDADLVLDRINVDAYLPVVAPTSVSGQTASPGQGDPADGPEPGNATAAPLTGLAVLKTFNANFKARVGQLVYHQTPIKDVLIDGTLHDGSLNLRQFRVKDVAGASVTVKGGVAKLGEVPVLENLAVDLKAKDLGRLMKLTGWDVSPVLANLGAVSVSAKGNGSLLDPVLYARVKAAGADIGLEGKAVLLPVPEFDADLSVRAKDLVRLVRALGVDYRPAGRLGGMDLALHAKGGLDAVQLSAIHGSVGSVNLSGTGNVVLSGDRPKVTANLATGEIPVDAFLPVRRTAAIERLPFGIPGLVPASFAVPDAPANDRAAVHPVGVRAGGIDPRWSRAPLDLSALKGLDADVVLDAAALVYQGHRFEEANVLLNLTNGVLRADKITGRLFGGSVNGAAVVDATGVPRLASTLKLQALDMAQAAGKGIAGGNLGLDLEISSSGTSVAELISALGGKGSIAVKGINVRKGAKGSALAGMLDLIMGLNQLGGTLGGKTDGIADLTGSFAIRNGIARSEDLTLVSAVGNGKATGMVDLAGWSLDVQGRVDLARNLLTQILIETAQQTISLPFTVNGPLDAPNVKLDTAKLPGGGVRIPGVRNLTDRLRKKKGVGAVLDTLLPGVLGGGQQPSTQGSTSADGGMAPPPPKSGSSEPQQQQKVKPEDLIKGIFGIRR